MFLKVLSPFSIKLHQKHVLFNSTLQTVYMFYIANEVCFSSSFLVSASPGAHLHAVCRWGSAAVSRPSLAVLAKDWGSSFPMRSCWVARPGRMVAHARLGP